MKTDAESKRKKERAIKIDIRCSASGDFAEDAAGLRQMEADGIDAIWIAERRHNPFFPLTIAAKSTHSIGLASLDALAFPRSPMVTAQIAWDLARQSRGRFVLGLSAHSSLPVVGRTDEHSFEAAGRMREYIESMRAIWNTFQNDERLRYRGEHYQFRLMVPFFNPGPIDYPDIPIYLSGDVLRLGELAGEVCQGLHAPRLHTSAYLRNVILPAVNRGLERGERNRDDFCLCVSPMIVSGLTPEATERSVRAAKIRIADFAHTETGRDSLRHHGWLGFSGIAQNQAEPPRRANLWRSVSDEMLGAFAIVAADAADIAEQIYQRYQGIADRVLLPWNQENRELASLVANELKQWRAMR